MKCFLLNYTNSDIRGRFEITLHAVTDTHAYIKIIIDSFRPLFFVPSEIPPEKTRAAAERKSLSLKAIDGTPVDCLYFSTYGSSIECARKLRSEGYPVYESDVHPVDRFLMERFICGSFDCNGPVQQTESILVSKNPLLRGTDYTPVLRVLSIDIETNAASEQIYSIALSGCTDDTVFIVGPSTNSQYIYCTDEKDLLEQFIQCIKKTDPDIFIGWNVIDYDLRVIQSRCEKHGIAFDIGRDRYSRIIPSRNSSQMIARIPGRLVMDVPVMLRSYFYTFEEYSLNFVASEMLGKTKSIELTDQDKINEINRQFAEDKEQLAAYNLQDAVLTLEIFDKAKILPNAIERAKRSGHLLDRSIGSIAAFDYLYLPHLHRAGYVAKDALDAVTATEPLPGGYVVEPTPGLYHNVLVFDFRSLYPSIIATFKIDPLGYIVKDPDTVGNPSGTQFSRNTTILPKIILELLDARAAAKKADNPYLSQAIKILMNSFYGVLGAQNCRFFSSALATSITKTGQHILKTMINYIAENTPYKVIYGDTDSLFVHAGKAITESADLIGTRISAAATEWLAQYIRNTFNTESYLRLEYQNTFNHFFLPSVRGATHGSKKHYCGSTVTGDTMELIFKGMESARSDWTELAKEFQHELYIRFFRSEPLDNYICEMVAKLQNGHFDQKLIYKKRLRKDLEEYTVNVPPHVQAARLLDSPKHIIRYYITKNGPQPIGKFSSQIDYNHYIDCQLRPIADSILETTGKSFDKIISGQQDLFEV
jgi:DNA polymerase II